MVYPSTRVDGIYDHMALKMILCYMSNQRSSKRWYWPLQHFTLYCPGILNEESLGFILFPSLLTPLPHCKFIECLQLHATEDGVEDMLHMIARLSIPFIVVGWLLRSQTFRDVKALFETSIKYGVFEYVASKLFTTKLSASNAVS